MADYLGRETERPTRTAGLQLMSMDPELHTKIPTDPNVPGVPGLAIFFIIIGAAGILTAVFLAGDALSSVGSAGLSMAVALGVVFGSMLDVRGGLGTHAPTRDRVLPEGCTSSCRRTAMTPRTLLGYYEAR